MYVSAPNLNAGAEPVKNASSEHGPTLVRQPESSKGFTMSSIMRCKYVGLQLKLSRPLQSSPESESDEVDQEEVAQGNSLSLPEISEEKNEGEDSRVEDERSEHDEG